MKFHKKRKLPLRLKKPIGKLFACRRIPFNQRELYATCMDFYDKSTYLIYFSTHNLEQAALILLNLRQGRSSSASLCKVFNSNILFYLQAKLMNFLGMLVRMAHQLLELIDSTKLNASFLRDVKPLDKPLNGNFLSFSPTRRL